jgi:hypothetical protein
MQKTFTKQNQFGHWVGGFVREDGTECSVTNAQFTEARARAIVEAIVRRQTNKKPII